MKFTDFETEDFLAVAYARQEEQEQFNELMEWVAQECEPEPTDQDLQDMEEEWSKWEA